MGKKAKFRKIKINIIEGEIDMFLQFYGWILECGWGICRDFGWEIVRF